jgi:GTPase SAR1 family protein
MTANPTSTRIKRLEKHLQLENPVLADCVQSFRKLDSIARGLGLMAADESYTTQVSWWPVISVLGTFSAGKSTFLNQYVGLDLQRTGNQAVDDKFTVICFGTDDTATALPGLALDSDPRFPFYQISQNIEKVSEGEGRRVDSYLQLKAVKADALRGKILIDSPGFDADRQRTSTLLITEHIIDLSDLVLVFFDARHPEPGAMSDTLQHLVSETVNRPDATKFLYILNQIDNTAREDNPEDVVAAWQRALAQHGLTAGRFYCIYARGVALNAADEAVRERLERKRDVDIAEIEGRILQVEVERAYRVLGMLEKTAVHIRDSLVPRVVAARKMWRRRTTWLCGIVFGSLAAVLLWGILQAGYWESLRSLPAAALYQPKGLAIIAAGLIVTWFVFSRLRALAGRSVLRHLTRDDPLDADARRVADAFAWNLTTWRWNSLAPSRPRGWSRRRQRKLTAVLSDADKYVQLLNDKYAKPSGGKS